MISDNNLPDPGENAVFQYRHDRSNKQRPNETHIEFKAGFGPMHMDIHFTLDLCYVCAELFHTVCVAKLDNNESEIVKPMLIPIQYESTLGRLEDSFYVSEIKLSPDASFLYVSNSGDNSLAIFIIQTDVKLQRVDLIPTVVKFPCHFEISPCGKAVIVTIKDSSQPCVLSRNVDTGLLDITNEASIFRFPITFELLMVYKG